MLQRRLLQPFNSKGPLHNRKARGWNHRLQGTASKGCSGSCIRDCASTGHAVSRGRRCLRARGDVEQLGCQARVIFHTR